MLSFTYSIVFDNGHLKADTVEGRKFSNTLLASMRKGQDGNTDKPLLVKIHDDIWHRVLKVHLIPNHSLQTLTRE